MLTRRLVPFLIALGLLLYVIKDISFYDIGRQIEFVNYKWIGLATCIGVINSILRGKRWQQALLGLGYRTTTFKTTIAMQAGQIASMIVIGSGEITRCITIQRTDTVPLSHALGSVVAERVVDLLMLILMIVLAFVLELGRMLSYLESITSTLSVKSIIISIVIVLVGTTTLYYICHLPVISKHPLWKRLNGFIYGFQKGFLSLRQLPNPFLFIALSMISQLLNWIGNYCFFQSLNILQNLPFTASLTTMVLVLVSSLAIPTQGSIGTYHFIVSRVLILYGIPLSNGIVAVTIIHGVSFAIALLLSSISFLIIPFLINKEPSNPDTVADTLPPDAAPETE